MFTHIALLSLLAVAGVTPVTAPTASGPKVEVWTNRGEDPYTAGEAVRVSFQTDQDAYVTVLRIDTDGRVRVLFPREPWEDNFARGGHIYEVQGTSWTVGFRADDYPGEGYVFAVAAADPFTYEPIEGDERWDYELIADGGRIRGDPYAALTELAARIVSPGSSDWDYDVTPYFVQRHYEYPRFLCYDCHTYVSVPTWNPYDYSCVRFRVVVYDDPYYYPYRSYGGTRVVFSRPLRPEPRFIFKDRNGSDAFVTRVRERPVNDNRRRDVGVRGRDIGSPGTVPPPRVITPRARPIFPSERGGGDRPERSWRPDHPARPEQPDRPTGSERLTRREGQGQPERARPTPRPSPSPSVPRSRPDHGTETPARRAPPAAEPARPRQAARAEPARGAQRNNGKPSEPELRRRKP